MRIKRYKVSFPKRDWSLVRRCKLHPGTVDETMIVVDRRYFFTTLLNSECYFPDFIVLARYLYLEGKDWNEFKYCFDKVNMYTRYFHRVRLKGKGHKFNLMHKFYIKGNDEDIRLMSGDKFDLDVCDFVRKPNKPDYDLLHRVSIEIGQKLPRIIAFLCNKKRNGAEGMTIESFYNEMFGDWWKRTE